MDHQKAVEVAEWLTRIGEKSVNGVAFGCVSPVKVTLKDEVFFGAQYLLFYETHQPSARFYLLGDLPKTYKKRKATCYVFRNKPNDWFISGWYNTAWLRKNRYPCTPDTVIHPFGDYFSLGEWTAEGGIELGEDVKYHRHPSSVEIL
jgi:hypothetical protein